MNRLPQGIRLVSIHSPYDCWNIKSVQKLFCETLSMRLAGYGSEYGEGVFPLDGADFAGAHHLVCRERGVGELEPVMGFRSTAFSTAKRFGLPFGGLGLARSSGDPAHAIALQAQLDECARSAQEISYIASWTMSPDVRKDPALKVLLRELFMAMAVHWHQDTESAIVGGCTMRFKVDRWFSGWGFKALQKEGVDLSPIEVPFLVGEKVRMMVLRAFTPEILEEASPWREVWESRTILDHGQGSVIPLRKAG